MSFKFVHLDNVELFLYLISFLTSEVGTFVSSICNLERLISKSNVRTLIFDHNCLIMELKLSPQCMIANGYRRGNNL